MLYNSNQIQAIIPHRYPFLLVDTIESITDNTTIIGTKAVSANEMHFVGHFPQQHIMPGVLIMEAPAPCFCCHRKPIKVRLPILQAWKMSVSSNRSSLVTC